MSILRQRFLKSYQIATQHWREKIADDLRARKQMPAAILFYHRVADSYPNEWTISNRDFSQHIGWLKNNAKLVSLADIQRSQASGERSGLEVALTFDDGYAENCDWAIPELLDQQVPFTYFVTTENIELQKHFSHDSRVGRPLPVHTLEQLKQMVDAGVQIGCHTQTHPDLGRPHDHEFLLSEIRDARHKLQDWTGQSIDYFAFPYGLSNNISQASIDVIIESGYEGFVSAYGGWNWPGEDNYHLQRIHGDPGIASLTNWLTFDPRKLQRGSQILYKRNAQNAQLATASDLVNSK